MKNWVGGGWGGGGILEWLCRNKLLLNVSKTLYMIFTPRNKFMHDIDVKYMV